MKTMAFFNHWGGVGKTTLVYHIASMLADLGRRVLVVDLDPQSNLTAMCVDEERLESLWPLSERHTHTIIGCLRPIIKGPGDVRGPHIEAIDDRFGLIVGDLALSGFEDKLSKTWPKMLDGDEAAYRVQSAFRRILSAGAREHDAEIVLLDLGPNLGAVNRSALLAADHVVTPLSPDLFSMQGLCSLGPTLRAWRAEWAERLARKPAAVDETLELPEGELKPLGYLVMRAGRRIHRPVTAYEGWVRRAPGIYHQHVLGSSGGSTLTFETDPYCLGLLNHYQGLMPLARDARKPMFRLTPGDGAIGAHQSAVGRCREDFLDLANRLLLAAGAGH